MAVKEHEYLLVQEQKFATLFWDYSFVQQCLAG